MGMRPGNVGMDHLGPFWMNFRKTSEGGEGVVSHQKGFVAVFLVTLRGKNYEFSGKEGGGSLQWFRDCLEVFRKFIQNGSRIVPLGRRRSQMCQADIAILP